MKNEFYEKIRKREVNPIGVLPLSNHGGLCVYNIEYGIDDYAITGFDFGDEILDLRKNKILYSTSGRAFIRKGNMRYYFDNIERTNK